MSYISRYFHTSYILREFYNQLSRHKSLAKIRDVTATTKPKLAAMKNK